VAVGGVQVEEDRRRRAGRLGDEGVAPLLADGGHLWVEQQATTQGQGQAQGQYLADQEASRRRQAIQVSQWDDKRREAVVGLR
jgi:hypothetical protein